MSPPVDLATLNAEIDMWVGRFKEMAQRATGDTRTMLNTVVEEIQKNQKVFNAEYAKTEAEIQATVAEVQRSAQASLAAAEDIKARADQLLADAEAAAKMPPAPPPPPRIEPGLGATLRDELLERYSRPLPQHPGLAIQDFSAEYSPLSAESPAPAPPRADSSAELSDAVVAGLLQLAGVTSKDLLIHLGCGDGRVLISAASRFQARGLGVDSQAASIEQARENVRKARLHSLVTMKTSDPRREDCSQASVVILSLGSQGNEGVSLTLRHKLKPGARVVTADGPLPSWPSQQSTMVTDADGKAHRLHLWQSRAAVAGDSSIGSSGAEWHE